MKRFTIAASFLVLATAASAADLVVADARNVALKPGQVVQSGQALKLESGQRLTLITKDGRTLRLAGPYNAVPGATEGSAQAATVVEALAALRTQKDGRLTEAGVVRKMSLVPLPEPWVADAEAGGNVCVRQGEQLVFWRPVSVREEKVRLQPNDHSWTADAVWARGVDRIEVPAKLPLRNRNLYQIEVGEQQAVLTVQIVPKTVDEPAAQAAWMLEKGCTSQAAAMLAEIR
jgi:hypothetical protein